MAREHWGNLSTSDQPARGVFLCKPHGARRAEHLSELRFNDSPRCSLAGVDRCMRGPSGCEVAVTRLTVARSQAAAMCYGLTCAQLDAASHLRLAGFGAASTSLLGALRATLLEPSRHCIALAFGQCHSVFLRTPQQITLLEHSCCALSRPFKRRGQHALLPELRLLPEWGRKHRHRIF